VKEKFIMKKSGIITALIALLSISCLCYAKSAKKSKAGFGIVIHGGAGVILKENMSTKEDKEYRAKLTEALEAGYKVLSGGGPALDAVLMKDLKEALEDEHKGRLFERNKKGQWIRLKKRGSSSEKLKH
jgi:beta-aspartyl-peptidase (threonine type)